MHCALRAQAQVWQMRMAIGIRAWDQHLQHTPAVEPVECMSSCVGV